MSHLTSSSVLLHGCTCTVSLGLPHVCCLPEPHLTGSVYLDFIMLLPKENTVLNPSTASQVITEVLTNQILHLHLEASLTTEAHKNKGFPGGYKQ